MQAVEIHGYLSRAKDFLKGMSLPEDLAERECKYSSALLAIHSAISYSDALRVGLGEKTSELASSDHKNASTKLQKLLNERKYDRQQGIRHFERLVGSKSRVAYSSDTLTEQEVMRMIDRAQSFSVWVNITGSELKLQGWRDDES